jgi:RNA polymerase sigma factor (sigma-70 family)
MCCPAPTNIWRRSFVSDSVIGAMTVALPGEAAPEPAARIGILFDVHHQRLYRLARRLSANAEEAGDLVQETFLRAARSPNSLPAGNEEAWLVRVLVNIRRDEWRRDAARRRLDPEGRAHAARPEPVDQEAAFIARTTVWRALERLSPRRRAVLVLHELEGESVPAVARLLGVTAVTVRWHLSRGRRELAAVIRDSGDRGQTR